MRSPKTIYTTAIPGRNPNMCGGTVWKCPKCRYYPGTTEFPYQQCYNCGEQLIYDEPDDKMVRIDLVPTSYGWTIQRPEVPEFPEDYVYDAIGRRRRVW